MTYARPLISVVAALGIATGMAWAPAALAQSQAPQDQPQQMEGQPFSQEALQSYAAATLEIERIHESYGPAIEAAGTPEEQEAIQQEAHDEMLDVVEDEGLSVEQYNQIYMAAQADPALASQISQYIVELY